LSTNLINVQSRIKRAFELARTQKQAYADLYSFLEPLFLLQEEVKEKISLKALDIPSHLAQTKWSEGFPLLMRWEFPIDTDSAGAVLQAMETLIPAENEGMKTARSALSQSLEAHHGFETPFWETFLQMDPSTWVEWSEKEGIDFAAFLFVARSCLRPSLERSAEDILMKTPQPQKWHKGYCPVCGSLPSLLFTAGEGDRKGYCSWCGTRWDIQKFLCPSCDNKDHTRLGYLYTDTEPQYRVHYCEECKKYFKQIEAKELIEEPYFPLEEWITLHLDLIAQRAGWLQPESPSPTVYGPGQ
jgi:FdhE protein